jgi:hypothetical protein
MSTELYTGHEAEMQALQEQDLRYAAIAVEARHIAEAAEVLDAARIGSLPPKEDLFGVVVPAIEQVEAAHAAMSQAWARLQRAMQQIDM